MKEINKGRILAFVQFFLLAAILIISFVFRNGHFTYNIRTISGLIIIAVGLIIGVIAVYHINQRISPNPYPFKSAVLITGGIYKFIRHPMYLSVILMTIGYCICIFSIYSMISIFVILAFFNIKIIFEEKALKDRFSEYEDYKKSTYKLLPFLY